MLDNLLEIEVAYNLITSGNDDKGGKDPIDAHYEKLKTKVSVLPKETDEFKVITKLYKTYFTIFMGFFAIFKKIFFKGFLKELF